MYAFLASWRYNDSITIRNCIIVHEDNISTIVLPVSDINKDENITDVTMSIISFVNNMTRLTS